MDDPEGNVLQTCEDSVHTKSAESDKLQQMVKEIAEKTIKIKYPHDYLKNGWILPSGGVNMIILICFPAPLEK